MGNNSGNDTPWKSAKDKVESETRNYEQKKHDAITSSPVKKLAGHLDTSTREYIEHQVMSEPYWFQKIEVMPGLFTPGWSDPATEKLPVYGLPEDLSGLRVLDVGCAEGFFSFEAERRGAREVIAIDSFPDSVRRFNIIKSARQSSATAYLCNVYDLDKKKFGTFDLVLFYGVFYHLKHPQLALEKIADICTGKLLFQTHIHEEPSLKGTPWAKYHPYGIMSGTDKQSFDPTVFWLFNSACCVAMLDHLGFKNIETVSEDPQPFVLTAEAAAIERGYPVNQATAPWC